jgi:VWFA-related protein
VNQALLFLTAVALTSIAVMAQQGAVIQTETRVVLVDAIVTGKNGAYVRDLTAKDFRVWQDNKEQTIRSLSLESASTASQPRPMVLFFDESSMEARDQVQLRQLASSFIDAEMGPNRKMAVVSYNGGLRIGQNFTDNAGRLKDALPKPDSRVPEAETQQGRPQLGAAPTVMAVDNGAARNMIRSLRELGKSLGVLPGRKIVVLFVGKLPSSSNQRSDLREAIDECNKSGVALYPIDVRPVSVQTDSGDQTFPGSNSRGGRMQRGGGPRGDPDDVQVGNISDAGGGNQQLLYEMASGTGGFVIQTTNDLLGGLQKIASEQDEYYVLSYTPPDSKEGSCHQLRVKVDRGGTNVRARSSYCTSKPLDLLAGTITGQDLEKRAAAAEAGNMAAQIALPYFYVSPNVARVHVAMEITPGALKFENQKGRLHAEINLLGITTTTDGGVRARFSDSLKFDFDNEAQIGSWRTKPLHYEKEFRIAPGQYSFTMAFGQGNQGDAASFGKVEKALVVDPWAGAELALSGLALSREAHPAADLGLGISIEGRTPLVAGGAQIVPSGSEVFSKSESGSFYVEVYAPDPASVAARVRVLDRQTGQPKWDSGPTKFPLPAGGGKPSMPAIGSLPLQAVAPGTYRLEITASDSAGKQATRTADFEVR